MASRHPLAFPPNRAHHRLAVMSADADEIGAAADRDLAAIE
jgi:hypothetical protein